MKIKVLFLMILSACLAVLPGCVGTEDGHSVAGVPFTTDKFVSRYQVPASRLVTVTRNVLSRNGKILVDNAVNNSFQAKINQHNVWVKVTDIDGRISEVAVQARGSMGGDPQLASEISKQIGMMLAAGQ